MAVVPVGGGWLAEFGLGRATKFDDVCLIRRRQTSVRCTATLDQPTIDNSNKHAVVNGEAWHRSSLSAE